MSAVPLARAGQMNSEQLFAHAADPVGVDEYGLIARGITLRTGAQAGVLAVFSHVDRLVQVLGRSGDAPGGDALAAALAAGDGFVGRVLESGRPASEPIDAERDRTFGPHVTFASGAPILPPGGPPGALCVGFSSRPTDTALTLWQVEGYARIASLCLHEAGALDGLLAVARLDALTGCLNYAAVWAELDREIQRSERHGRTMSCCFIDLDGFKHVNDRHGHLYGNEVLADVAAVLRHGVRSGDTVGRYGGDEFLAILPDTGEAEACALSERLRLKILTTKPSGNDQWLDTSIGVAEWRPGSKADEMLAAADAALLRAKDGGGGIVVGAGDVAARTRRDVVRGHAAFRRPRG